jgi:hypothetical protein
MTQALSKNFLKNPSLQGISIDVKYANLLNSTKSGETDMTTFDINTPLEERIKTVMSDMDQMSCENKIWCTACNGEGHFEADECDRRLSGSALQCHECLGDGSRWLSRVPYWEIENFLRRRKAFHEMLGPDEMDVVPIVEANENWTINNVGDKVSYAIRVADIPQDVIDQCLAISYSGTGWEVRHGRFSGNTLSFRLHGNGYIPKSEEAELTNALEQSFSTAKSLIDAAKALVQNA